jgi:hypothetical protein
MSKFQRLLKTIRFMVEPWHPPKRPAFATDDELEIRRAVARDLLGETQVKPVLGRPLDYDREPPPV